MPLNDRELSHPPNKNVGDEQTPVPTDISVLIVPVDKSPCGWVYKGRVKIPGSKKSGPGTEVALSRKRKMVNSRRPGDTEIVQNSDEESTLRRS